MTDMAQQNTAWTEALDENELEAGDDVRLRNTANGSVELEGTVRDSLHGVGTVQVRVGGVRTSEVYAEGDGEWTKRGTPWTYTLEVRREVATDGGQEQAERTEDRTPGEAAVALAQEGDRVALEGYTRGAIEAEDAQAEYEVVERVNAHTLKVRRVKDSGRLGGYARMKAHATGEGVRVQANGNGDPGVVWASAVLVGHEGEQAGHRVCLNCRRFADSFTPVECSHSSTGRTGCPYCLEADPLRAVVHEVGDERTVYGGYCSSRQRGHGHQVSLECARALTE